MPEEPTCEFTKGDNTKCTLASQFLVMTQIPPYTQAHTCHEHLPIFVDRLLGTERCPVVIRRVCPYPDWTWS